MPQCGHLSKLILKYGTSFLKLKSKDFKAFALGYKSGTTVLHLNKNCFTEYTIKLPEKDLLLELSRVIEINYKKISQIIEENKK